MTDSEKLDRAPVMERCFVALWPDADARDRLEALARRLQLSCPGSRPTERENLHLTLAFIGPLDSGKGSIISEMLAAIEAPRFSWTIDRVGGFERARVVWAGGGTDEPRLAALSLAARKGLDALQVPYDRKPFVPHVTLLRKIIRPGAPEPIEPIRWSAAAPVLTVSRRDERGHVRYRPWRNDLAE